VRQLPDHPQRTLKTYRVKMTSWHGRSGIITGSVAGIIVSSLGERGSNDLQLGKKHAQTHTTGLTLVHGLSQQVRGLQQPALVQVVGLAHA